MTEWHLKSIAELSLALKNKEVTSVELTEHFLKRIEEFNPSLNCYIEITADLARVQRRIS